MDILVGVLGKQIPIVERLVSHKDLIASTMPHGDATDMNVHPTLRGL